MTRHSARSGGVLTALLHDRRGNTFALVAAAMIPLVGLIGGGVDMSRLYLTKTRLQQACDAGALAGRRAMGVNSWTTGANSPQATANAMFDGNFQQGDYGTGTRTRNYTASGSAVNGTATAVVPMAVMKAFGMTSRTLTVNCTADMAIPNTDVMFVLDVTGSMNCAIGVYCPGGNNGNTPATNSKIDGLKVAVKCFYEALAKVNTSEVCGSDPTGTTYSQTAQIRIGFVPYAVNVNVGKLLPHAYIADSWAYQTRVPNRPLTDVVVGYTPGATATQVNYVEGYASGSSWSSFTRWQTYTNITSSWACDNLVPADEYVITGAEGAAYGTGTSMSGSNQITYWYTQQPAVRYDYEVESYSSSQDRCRIKRRERNAVVTRTYNRTDTPIVEQQPVFQNWTYQQANLNVSGLKGSGASWNSSVMLPLGTTGTNDTSVSWSGCIEERQTVQNSDGNPSDEWGSIPASAYDMNIDLIPSATTGTKWGPLLPGAVWARYNSSGNDITSNRTTSSDLSRNYSTSCPQEAARLTQWDTASPSGTRPWETSGSFATYVNSLSATGNTYHDIGLIWGARFISPTGIFASTNTNLNAINRHIIFMTDGLTQTRKDDYSAYGVHWWDRRQTTYAPSATDLDNILNARLSALCTAIKNKNITLWVIYFGPLSTTDADEVAAASRLSACATSGKYYNATNNAALVSQFRQIASDIAELRLTQ